MVANAIEYSIAKLSIRAPSINGLPQYRKYDRNALTFVDKLVLFSHFTVQSVEKYTRPTICISFAQKC